MAAAEQYETLMLQITETIFGGYEVMLFDQSFGETIIFCQLLKEYKRLFNKKIFIFYKRNSLTTLLENCPEINALLLIKPEVYQQLAGSGYLITRCRVKDFEIMHSIVGISKKNVVTELCDFMRIPFDSPRTPYSLPDSDVFQNNPFLDDFLSDSKVIYLIPDANFLSGSVSTDFWVSIAKSLKDKGYKLLINSQVEILPDEAHVFPDILSCVTIARRCSCVLGVRTGLMDIIASFTDTPIIGVYPDDTHPSWGCCSWTFNVEKDKAASYMKGWSIAKFFREKNVFEPVNKDAAALTEEILAALDSISP